MAQTDGEPHFLKLVLSAKLVSLDTLLAHLADITVSVRSLTLMRSNQRKLTKFFKNEAMALSLSLVFLRSKLGSFFDGI